MRTKIAIFFTAAIFAAFCQKGYALGGTLCVEGPLDVDAPGSANTLTSKAPCTQPGRSIADFSAAAASAVDWWPSWSMAYDSGCTWTFSNLPAGVSGDSGTGRITGTLPGSAATYAGISATCTTAQGANTESWTLTTTGGLSPTMQLLSGYYVSGTYGSGPGAEVCLVNEDTNTASLGGDLEGSLLACLKDRNGPANDPTPREIQFAGDSYTLFQSANYNFDCGKLSINGASAPSGSVLLSKEGPFGDGVTANGGLAVTNGGCNNGADTYIQLVHLDGVKPEGDPDKVNGSGGLGIDGENGGAAVNNVVFDRVTVTNVQDDALTIYGAATGVTVYRPLLAQSGRGMGITYFDENLARTDIAVIDPLFIRNTERNPVVRADSNDIDIHNPVLHAFGPLQHNVGGLQTTAGINIRGRGTPVVCPESVNIIGAHATSSADSSFLSAALNFRDSCATTQTYFTGRLPSEETESGGAGSAFATGIAYVATPPLDVITNAGVANETSQVAALKAEARAQVNIDLGIAGNTPAFWEPQPLTRCQELVNAGGSCGDGSLHCADSWDDFATIQADPSFGPGDAIALRAAGSWDNTCTVNTNGSGCAVMTEDGTGEAQSQRLHMCNYPGESVVLTGSGSEAAWDDVASLTTPTANPNQAPFVITGDYWTLASENNRLRAEWFGGPGVNVAGDYAKIEGLDLQYIYARPGIALSHDIDPADGDILNAEIRYNIIRNTYRESSINIHFENGTWEVRDTIIEYNVLLDAGIEADGERVQPAQGDSGGGGNADLIAWKNQCDEQVPQNQCFDTVVRWNYGRRGADDCLDFDNDGVDLINNFWSECGPAGTQGVKQKNPTPNYNLVRNFFHGGDRSQFTSASDNIIAFSSQDIATASEGNAILHNSALYAVSTGRGEGISYDNDQNTIGAHNVASFNSTNFRGGAKATDLASDDPALYAGTPAAALPAIDLVSLESTSLSATDKLRVLFEQLQDIYEPAAGSALIDAGDETITNGAGETFFCATAQDDPTNPNTATDCAPWTGAAPDKGWTDRGLFD